MARFLDIATQAGFTFIDENSTRLIKEVCQGYSLEVTLEDETWDELYEVGLYFWSPRFGKTMEILFGNYAEIASAYHDRLLINDTRGCLSFLAAGWEKAPCGNMALYSAATYLSFEDLTARLASIQDALGIYRLLYEDIEAGFFTASELLWVYLYLSKEMGLSNDRILEKLAMQSNYFPAKTLKPVDKALLDVFQQAYENAQACMVGKI